MGRVEKIRTACRNCHGGCGLIAHVKDGKVIQEHGPEPACSLACPTRCILWGDIKAISAEIEQRLL